MSSLDAHLKALLEELSAELPEVTTRFMFGSDAFFARGHIYALVWDGRVVLKLQDEPRYQAAMALDGAEGFDPMRRPGGRAMTRWVVMPDTLADDAEALRPWLEAAHRGAFVAPPRVAKRARQKAPTRAGRPARRKA